MVNNLGNSILARPRTLRKECGKRVIILLDRWNSQPAVGWCETFCKFVDYLDKVDISYNAPMHGRTRYLNHFFVSGDPDLQVGPVEKREDCKKSLQALFCVRREQGRGKTFTPKDRNWKRSFFF